MNQPKCPDAKLLALYATDQLDAEQTQMIRAHLLTCDRCRDATDGLKPIDGLNPTAVYLSNDNATAKSPTRAEDETDQEMIVDLSVLSQSPKKDALGRMGKYDILEIIGHGGMGVVFRAFDEQLRRTVAIKVLTRALAKNATARRRFIREARAAAAINHLNVVTIHSVEEHESLPFLVMEYIRGASLRDHVRTAGPLDPTEIVRIAAQIAAGLAAAHAQGVIHRDIKPGNVMLESGIDRVKITDFGLARIAVDNVDLTTREMPVGTPAYMSPEQVIGGKVDFRTDLFSLGCLLYAMAKGQSPFRGDSALQVAHKVCEYCPPRLRQGNKDMPEFLSEIVDRLLQKKPEDRFQSAEELAGVLNRHLTAINLSRSNELTVTLQKQPIYSRRRKPMFKWLAPLLLLVVIATCVGLWWAKRPTEDGPYRDPDSSVPKKVKAPTITVASDGTADVSSINEALNRAGPGTTIMVNDDAIYEESLQINDEERWQDIRIVSPKGATIAPPEQGYAAVIIASTPGVKLSGFRIVPQMKQHAVMITGHCPGVTISEIRIDQPSIWAQIFIARQAAGTLEQPLTVKDSSFLVDRIGTVVQGDSDSKAVSFVQIVNNRFAGRGTHLQLNRTVREVEVTGNLFLGGGVALNLTGSASSNVSVSNNTFFQAEEIATPPTWLQLPSSPISLSGAEIERNVVVGDLDIACDAVLVDFPNQWSFENTVCQPGPNVDRQRLQNVVELVDEVRFVSKDSKNADFLRPLSTSPLASVDDEGRYAGALNPLRAITE